MKLRVLAFLICLAIVCSGCAMKTATSGTTAVSTPTVTSDSSKPVPEFPPLYVSRGRKAMRPVEEVFRSVESLRKTKRLTVAVLKPITKTTRFSAMLLSQCDLETLKVLVLSGYAPVVIIKSPVGPKHVRAVVGYDDMDGVLTLADPVNYAEAKLQYSEFSKQWDDPRKACLLVSARKGSVNTIKSALRTYLSEEKVDSVIIRK